VTETEKRLASWVKSDYCTMSSYSYPGSWVRKVRWGLSSKLELDHLHPSKTITSTSCMFPTSLATSATTFELGVPILIPSDKSRDISHRGLDASLAFGNTCTLGTCLTATSTSGRKTLVPGQTRRVRWSNDTWNAHCEYFARKRDCGKWDVISA
jgi:hypothetical protein